MRIAPRVLAVPYLQSAEGPSLTLGPAGDDTLSVVPDMDGGLAASRTPTPRQATADGAKTEADGNGDVWHVDVPGIADAVSLLRRWVRLLLADDAELAEAFELIVSEYGTNALWHSASGVPGGRIGVELRISDQQTHLTVLDDGPIPARSDENADPSEHGRGLILADAYADETGQYDCADGHAAWALINR
ncbi:sensor histidine kinase [Actinomadura darangshiensis]|uniref:Sensor histidine kinase n=1 Tax=Actinomadura darangshiensis TaxID=705336 RepID=A0A4R5BYK8_9ACTN|nr:ATP-binding protein [Actinomadura darangshiensis]TDD89514.1 sensor histidine kinase [Actinomadura darangshiensis]